MKFVEGHKRASEIDGGVESHLQEENTCEDAAFGISPMELLVVNCIGDEWRPDRSQIKPARSPIRHMPERRATGL